MARAKAGDGDSRVQALELSVMDWLGRIPADSLEMEPVVHPVG